MNLEELIASTPPMQQHALIKGFQAGAASRDEDVAAWSACEAAAKIPAVLEYVGQLEKERDQLREQVAMLRGSIQDAVDRLRNTDSWIWEDLVQALAATEPKT